MSIKDLVTDIKRNGLLASMPQLEELYQVAIANEQKLAESEARCAALAAEVYDLKHPGTYLPSKRETPALDAFLSEVRAQGVEMFAAVLRRKGDDAFFDAIAEAQANAADQFAAQLRKGVQS